MNGDSFKNNDMKYTMSTVLSDISHTYGNMTKIFEQFVKKNYPDGYFKDTQITTNSALRQMRLLRNKLDIKKKVPLLNISPRVNTSKTEALTNATEQAFGNSLYDITRPKFATNQCKFFKDFDKGIFIDYNIARTRMEFDVKIIVSEYYEAMNIWNHSRYKMRWDMPFFIETSIEIPLPDKFIRKISSDSGNIIFEEGSKDCKKFLGYLNTHSSFPIIYKFEPSMGQMHFFLVLSQRTLIQLEDLSLDKGGASGQVNERSHMTFGAYIEFNHPGTYYYLTSTHNGESDVINGDISIDDLSDTVDIQYGFNRKVIPQFYNNCQSFSHTKFKLDSAMDVLDLNSILDPVLCGIGRRGGYMARVFNQDGLDVIEAPHTKNVTSFYADYETNKINIYNGDAGDIYLLSIYVDNVMYNEVKLRNHQY